MILITGGTGFIGSHLLYQLVDSGKKVKALKRPASSTKLTEKIFSYYSTDAASKLKMIEWIDGDINDYYSLEDALRNIDYVYHAAAVVSFHAFDKNEIFKTNIEGTANLVNACLENDVKKLLFVSSIGALGRSVADGIVDEETHFQTSNKNSHYSTTKYEAEKEVWRGISEGLDAVIVNPAIVVGPGNWDRGSSQVFQTMWNRLKFYSTGMNGFIDVNDVAKAMVILMEGDFSGERYILSTENVSYKQFFEWMAKAMQIPAPRIKAGPFLSGIGWRVLKLKSMFSGKPSGITKETAKTANQVYQYSNKKLIEATGIKLIPIQESVKKTVGYFLQDHKKK